MMRTPILLTLSLVLCIAALVGGMPLAATAADAPTPIVKRPAGAVMVPDKFLRRWDPVTIFFDRDVGPAGGGPEHAPARIVTMAPAQPGAFTWLDARTLQFRPAEPWRPLTQVRWRIGDKTVELTTLMSAPISTEPQNGAEGLLPVAQIGLTLPEPIDAAWLKRVLTIELRALPGADSDPARRLGADDYVVKVGERKDRNDPAPYTLVLREPIPGGVKAVLKLRLSPVDRLDAEFYELGFATRAPFRIANVGCAAPARAASPAAAPADDDAADQNDSDQPATGDADQSQDAGASNKIARRAAALHMTDAAPIPAGGVSLAPEDALRCGPEDRSLLVRFSARLGELSPVAARNLVRLTPAVEDLGFTISGDTLVAQGKFKTGVNYRLGLQPAEIADVEGRPLAMAKPSQLYFNFAPQPKLFRWSFVEGIAERFGPRMLPVESRGYEQIDRRNHRLDPLDPAFWPFTAQVTTDDQAAPPGPGEAPAPAQPNNRDDVARYVMALGSPSLSEIVDLPRRRGDAGARFGLDVGGLLERIAGAGAPGAYLIGARPLDGTQRQWVRLQVTDLSLTTVEEDQAARFVVTSLKTAAPVAGAAIRVEAEVDHALRVLAQGTTDKAGAFVWTPPARGSKYAPLRVVVSKGDDVLALGFQRPAPELIRPAVDRASSDWLGWVSGGTTERVDAPQYKCHIFPDRPIYRPNEPVNIKGYVRTYDKGALAPVAPPVTLVVSGPDDLEWRYPVTLNSFGSFYHLFDQKTDVTDVFNIHLLVGKTECGTADFRKEAYRLPEFEVRVTAADIVPLDAPFPVKLTANYYAGGLVAGAPVRWRVTQFPYSWHAKSEPGFFYSTDARFSGDQPFDSKAALETLGKTDAQGGAEIALDPTAEKTAQPRRYVVEATVTGADDQTVTNTREVLALPPFILGVKLPRYLERARAIDPEIVALGPTGAPLVDQTITVRLKQRQWRSILQASDFTAGIAKYSTDTVDEPRGERTIKSRSEPVKLHLPIDGSGVYVVELEANDRQGRRQTISVDLFVGGGDTPVTWSRPPAASFKVTADKDGYKPGETANLVLESPFQNGAALVMVEHPDGKNAYDWLAVKNGTATFSLPIEKSFMPAVPVHIALMRGRLEGGDGAAVAGSADLRKPSTVVADQIVKVVPVKNTIQVALTYPDKVQPGDDADLTVKLSDDEGKPIGGEVTLWMVDSAVLALRKEARLDPLPDFIVAHPARLSVRDTRNLVLGQLPIEEMPGGDQRGEGDLLDTTTVRKNFTPLPYYNPDLVVDSSGQATVHVHMPDNLTNYKIRAKAVSGPDRFGVGTGVIAVRLPVQVQPALPRFVRAGDRFVLSALGRIVDGVGGPGRVQARVEGLALDGAASRDFDWTPSTPQRLDFDAQVADPGYGEDGQPRRDTVAITVGVERSGDHKRDAFAVTLPLRPDRRPVSARELALVTADHPLTLAALAEPARAGTVRRSLLLSIDPALVRMAAGLDYLLEYPFGCTEQRISRARAEIAARRLHDVLQFGGAPARFDVDIKATLDYLASAVNDDGLASFWPGSAPSVSLTAWVAQFMTEAKGAGYAVDGALYGRILGALKQTLRSNSPFLYPAEAYAERVWALSALAEAGDIDQGYAAELARRADQLDVESIAQILRVLRATKTVDRAVLDELEAKLWRGIVFRLNQGHEAYGGLQHAAATRGPVILPSEARTLAQIVRATAADAALAPRRELIVDSLLTAAGTTGWGDTNANAETLLALIARATEAAPQQTAQLELDLGGRHRSLTLGAEARAQKLVSLEGGEVKLALAGSNPAPVTALAEIRYLPSALGSTVAAQAAGFVVTRKLARVTGDALETLPFDRPGSEIALTVGEVVEDSLELVNPEDRHFIAVVMPLAAGMEPLNPALETAPPEATPSAPPSLKPAYVAFLDDQVAYYYDTLPKGTYRFATRTRATIPGRFTQPAAFAEAMYQETVNGNSHGATIVIERSHDAPAGTATAPKH
jgi:uncharacterized protein YfaS (alpha-2-macroglobulin family)